MVKLFGAALFEKKRVEKLYDFAQHGILRMDTGFGIDIYTQQVFAVGPGETAPGVKQERGKTAKKAVELTPKAIYELKTLNQPAFSINCAAGYISSEIKTLDAKLELFGPKPKSNKKRSANELFGTGEAGAVKYGRQEVESMLERLKNRMFYEGKKAVFEKYPYTTNDAIRKVLAKHKNLEAVTADVHIPDLPGEAITAMQDYTEVTLGIANKAPVFYLIREKEEEKAVQRKRDPILLAQSPFGFFWQILGAWDKEVVLLEEL